MTKDISEYPYPLTELQRQFPDAIVWPPELPKVTPPSFSDICINSVLHWPGWAVAALFLIPALMYTAWVVFSHLSTLGKLAQNNFVVRVFFVAWIASGVLSFFAIFLAWHRGWFTPLSCLPIFAFYAWELAMQVRWRCYVQIAFITALLYFIYTHTNPPLI